MIISEKLKIYFNAQFQCQTKSETYGNNCKLLRVEVYIYISS